jgi:hypothetical protein
MKPWDLGSGTGKLELALDRLRKAVRQAGEHWNDAAFRDFCQLYLEPMELSHRAAIDAITRLDQVLSQAERECGGQL